VNIAPDLGAPVERGWTIDVTGAHLRECAERGFTAVRLLVTFGAHRTEAHRTEAHRTEAHRTVPGLDPKALRRVEDIAAQAASLGLAVAISNNPGPELIASSP